MLNRFVMLLKDCPALGRVVIFCEGMSTISYPDKGTFLQQCPKKFLEYAVIKVEFDYVFSTTTRITIKKLDF